MIITITVYLLIWLAAAKLLAELFDWLSMIDGTSDEPVPIYMSLTFASSVIPLLIQSNK